MGLQGKVVVITGSTRGIGRAIAEEAVRGGATVVVSSRTSEAVARAVAEISAAAGSGATVSGFPADVSRWEDVEALRDSALAAHGRIDVWISNAGVSNGYRPLDEESPEEIRNLIATNVTGTLYGARAMIPYFRAHGGYLMNLCGRGRKGEATPFTAGYAASKAAIASITRSLAAENKDCPRVSVNALVPGMVDTDFYADVKTSPRLASTVGNIRLALDAFGTPVAEVGRRAVALIAEEPGAATGRIFTMLSARQMITGGAKMAYWGMTGKLAR
ncbi:MAG: SDR family oxidoreductase [Coriobacteriia bacterium]|nr:SDR family oxidoreductase [Coriobacteriia bacterium]